ATEKKIFLDESPSDSTDQILKLGNAPFNSPATRLPVLVKPALSNKHYTAVPCLIGALTSEQDLDDRLPMYLGLSVSDQYHIYQSLHTDSISFAHTLEG
ncbi:hypothetical protein L9F63_022869, partial [Diploptera punctata]